MKKICEMYFEILSYKLGIAILAILPFLFVQKNIFYALFWEMIVVVIATIVTGKLYNKKECLKFSLIYAASFFLIEFITFCFGLHNSPFAFLTLAFYVLAIILAFVVKTILWFVLGGLIFYLTNLITFKIVKNEHLENFFNPIKSFLANPIIFFTTVIVIFALKFLFTGQFVVVEELPTIDKPQVKVLTVLDDEKLLLLINKGSEFVVYDAKNDVLTSKNISLIPAPAGFMPDYNAYSLSKMKNGNIFFRRFFVNQNDRRDIITIATIFSPEKNIILSEFELPKEISSFQSSATFIDEENALFIGNYTNNKTYLFNVNDKSLVEKAETIQNRRCAKSILLNNGKVFIIGGGARNGNSVELYDIKNNKFTEIPLDINLYYSFSKDDLQLLDNGNVFIKTGKLEDKEENGIGNYVSGNFGTGYPIPYILIFNPNDNSFQGINFNANRRIKLNNFTSTSVTNDGKVLFAGGTRLWHKRDVGNNQKIYFYNIKNGKIRETYFYKFNESYKPQIFVLNNNEAIIFFMPLLGSKEAKCNYLKVKF